MDRATNRETREFFAAVADSGDETGLTKLVAPTLLVRLLILDPEPVRWTSGENKLPQAEFRVTVQKPADLDLAALRAHPPDAILIVARMPRVQVAEVSNTILEFAKHRDFAVLLLVGDNDEACIEHWYALDFDILSKPLAWAVLPKQIQRSVHVARARELYRAVERRNRALLRAIPDMVFVLEENGALIDHFGRSAASVAGKQIDALESIDELLSPEGVQKVHSFLGALHRTREPQLFEHKERGHQFETRLMLQPDGTALTIVRDITTRKRNEAKIRHLAFYDQLTGLANRQHLQRALQVYLKRSRRDGDIAILYIDLDRFKRINDTFGHEVGDGLLKAVAKRLERSLRDEGSRDESESRTRPLFARLSGDEFAVVLRDMPDDNAIAAVAHRVQATLSSPFLYDRHQFVITPSIGISVYPRDGDSAKTLLRAADAAMYRAKAEGRNHTCFYSTTMLVRSLDRLEMENDLRRALQKGDLSLVYQPKVDMAGWSIAGMEALLRWHHPVRGWVSPSEFVPIAEETGLMLELGEWVFKKVCSQWRKWARRGIKTSVAINISSEQFRFGEITPFVLRAIERQWIEAECLELEITESLLMRNVPDTVDALRSIRDAGVRLTVDDFGTGYSSLSYLKHFPLHALKIDRSFVRDLHTSRDDAAICAAILAMARELGLKVIAEGVETEEQLAFLKLHGCDQFQGFLCSKPLPPDEATELLRHGVVPPARHLTAVSA